MCIRDRTELVSGEIAEDLTYYFAKSEQIPSAIALGVLVDTDTSIKEAGGFIIQVMPGITEEILERLESRINVIPYITELLSMGDTPESILNLIPVSYTHLDVYKRQVVRPAAFNDFKMT